MIDLCSQEFLRNQSLSDPNPIITESLPAVPPGGLDLARDAHAVTPPGLPKQSMRGFTGGLARLAGLLAEGAILLALLACACLLAYEALQAFTRSV